MNENKYLHENKYLYTKKNIDNRNFSSFMLRIMTSLWVSFVRMCSKPPFEDYCYVNEDRLYNTSEYHEHSLPFSCSSKQVICSEDISYFIVLTDTLQLPSCRYGKP